MNIPALSSLRPISETLNQASPALIERLFDQQSILAHVVKTAQSQRVMLVTSYGNLEGTNALDLKAGDRVTIRLDSSKEKPVLKVSVIAEQAYSIETSKNKELAKLLPPGQTLVARVVQQTATTTGLRIAATDYSPEHKIDLAANQLVLLKASPERDKIDILPITNRQLLKTVLARNLPALPDKPGVDGMTKLLRLVHCGLQPLVSAPRVSQIADSRSGSFTTQRGPEVLGTKAFALHTVSNSAAKVSTAAPVDPTSHAQYLSQNPVQSTLAQLFAPGATIQLIRALNPSQPASTPAQLAPGETSHETTSRLIELLDQTPRLKTITSAVIRQWFSDCGIVRPAPGNNKDNTQNILSFVAKLSNDETFLQEFNRLLNNPAKIARNGSATREKTPADDANMQSLTRDIVKLIEQSSSQNLFQRTQLRYQQEIQQPITINLTIPMLDQETVNPLQLKIKQYKKSQCDGETGWDIQLCFDFAELGKISSHILLDGIQLSVSFWAVEAATKHKIDDQIGNFKAQLGNAGFELKHIYCFLGEEPGQTDISVADFPERILDIKV